MPGPPPKDPSAARLCDGARAVVFDFVVPQVQVHQLGVGVLLQRPRNLDGARIALCLTRRPVNVTPATALTLRQ